MMIWPVKNSYSKQLPQKGQPGSFWEDRGDRFHCGIDIYAPIGSDVISIEDGNVVSVGTATSPQQISYWNKTHYVVIRNDSGLFCKYAELDDLMVKDGESVEPGQLIGHVGLVLNSSRIDKFSPVYIQKLRDKNPSMLHFELYSREPIQSHKNYCGGNWFGPSKPSNLLDPTDYLETA